MRKSRKWMFFFFEPSLIQKKVLEDLYVVGGTFKDIHREKYRQIKLQRLQKIQIWEFGS